MMKSNIYACDFETTVYKNQTKTEVWSAAFVQLHSEDVTILGNIADFIAYFEKLDKDCILYFHNLKFDGSFILDYLKRNKKYNEATYNVERMSLLNDKIEQIIKLKKPKNLEPYNYTYSISDRGQWYTITIKFKNKVIEIRDSLKLLPFTLKQIGSAFDTKHKKLEMEYTGFRFPNCEISGEEKKYIENDVLVLKEALEFMQSEKHLSLTIGSACMREYKLIMRNNMIDLAKVMPDLSKITIPNLGITSEQYIRKTYRGGWCYAVEDATNQVTDAGSTADVNSLYPSMMHSASGNTFPTGKGKYINGSDILNYINNKKYYCFIHIKTRFYLKENYLPFIQIKGTWKYKSTEMLKTSDILLNGKYYDYYTDFDGTLQPAIADLYLTEVDYRLLKDHYNLTDTTIVDGYVFAALDAGILFDDYINKYMQIKMNSKGAKRTLAKLFLNNLYGKMATSTDSSYKVALMDTEDDCLEYISFQENDKKCGYIPIGSAITSYARNFTIRAAQLNYHGTDKPGFRYADTDSIHCTLPPEELKGINIDSKKLCCWKIESLWDKAIFVRQKTYIEHIVKEDNEPCEPHYSITCAGMPENCKQKFITQLENETASLNDFKVGLKIHGKLIPKRITGGILLVESDFTMR